MITRVDVMNSIVDGIVNLVTDAFNVKDEIVDIGTDAVFGAAELGIKGLEKTLDIKDELMYKVGL